MAWSSTTSTKSRDSTAAGACPTNRSRGRYSFRTTAIRCTSGISGFSRSNPSPPRGSNMPPCTGQLTTAELREAIDRLPRFPLGHFPTPLEPAARFSKALGGPQVYIKRDDCTGLAFGGNKTRHNEFLIADALQQGADIIVWGAGVQSNNCRQTAAACAKLGLECRLYLTRANHNPDIQGNLLLD